MWVVKIFVLFFVSNVHGLHLPKYITPCTFNSVDFKECAIKQGNAALPHVVNGDRQIGFPSFVPFKISSITTTANGLSMNLTDATFTGVENLKLQDYVFDPVKKIISMTLGGPLLTLEFDYATGGKIASLPIEGRGHGWVKFYNGNYTYAHQFDVKTKNDKQYIVIGKDDIKIEPEKMESKLDNLFNGDKLLGDNLNKFLNENWKELLTEFGPTITEVFGAIARGIFSKLYDKVSTEEMFPGLVL